MMSKSAKEVFNNPDIQVLLTRNILKKTDFFRMSSGVLLSLQNEGVYYLMLLGKISLANLRDLDYSDDLIESLKCPRIAHLLKDDVIKLVDLGNVYPIHLKVIAIPEIYELIASRKLKFFDLTLNFCKAILIPFVRVNFLSFTVDELKVISADAILALENNDITALLEDKVLSKQKLLNICSNCRRALENVCIRELFRSKVICYEDLYQVNDCVLEFVNADLVHSLQSGVVPKSFLFNIERQRSVFGYM
ncbi:MAG: hypothetical protein VX335_03980 [Pseudomonadota bacterium]|nr:hypothetical protein [Pseudomonadota bacterium]